MLWKEERVGGVETVTSYELRVVPEVRDHGVTVFIIAFSFQLHEGADPEDYGVEQQIAAKACPTAYLICVTHRPVGNTLTGTS